jgi:uncharacterized protein (TIRG00374 family)
MKKIILNSLKVTISVGLLAYLIYLADIEKILVTLRVVKLQYFALALSAFILCVFLLSRRWQILLNQVKIYPKFNTLVNFYFIGFFFNNFLPTTIGGDVSRAYNAAKISGKKADSIGTILLERMMGLLATLTLASLSMFWVMKYFHTPRIIFLTVALLGFIIFVLANLLIPTTFNFTIKILKRITVFNLGDRVKNVLSTVHSYRENKKIILFAYLISLCSQATLILMNYVLAQSLHLQNVTLGFLFIVVPVTFILGLFPSVNGLGVRDSGYVFLLTRVGLSPAEALSLSFLNTLVPVVMSLYGGLLLIFYRHKKEMEPFREMKAEIE